MVERSQSKKTVSCKLFWEVVWDKAKQKYEKENGQEDFDRQKNEESDCPKHFRFVSSGPWSTMELGI